VADRLGVLKTYKLFVGGKFPRSESGRTLRVAGAEGVPVAHVCRASRKDLREAVEAARAALPRWSGEAPVGATAYLRGQVLYRLAEMLEGKRGELREALGAGASRASDPDDEINRCIDRVVAYAGWTDKIAQVLGCANSVAGPYHNFTVPEAIGVTGVVSPDEPSLLGLLSLTLAPLCAGGTVVALASESNPIAACVLAEGLATSDLPGGAFNVLTGLREELAPHIASHRGIDAVHASGVNDEEARVLRGGVAENLKRVTIRGEVEWWDDGVCESPGWLDAFVEFKTIWHPSGA